MLQYIVKINYYKFVFKEDEFMSAMEFAKKAKLHSEDNDVGVKIEVEFVNQEQEG